MPISKAVIPAAGLGTRFLPATKAMPKEMLPVVDKPAIQYVVEEAVNAGLHDVLMVTGRNKNALENHFDRATELEAVLTRKGDQRRLEEVVRSTNLATMHYVRQRDPLGLGHAVLRAQMHVKTPMELYWRAPFDHIRTTACLHPPLRMVRNPPGRQRLSLLSGLAETACRQPAATID